MRRVECFRGSRDLVMRVIGAVGIDPGPNRPPVNVMQRISVAQFSHPREEAQDPLPLLQRIRAVRDTPVSTPAFAQVNSRADDFDRLNFRCVPGESGK